MGITAIAIGLSLAFASPTAAAQQAQPDAFTLAGALDRCMATHAVRLNHSDATDEVIYEQASRSCRPLRDRVTVAVRAQLRPEQAAEIVRWMDIQGRPNFMAMLTRIRSDRAGRAAGGN